MATALSKLSLKLRLTALYVALLAVLLTALGVVIYLDTRHFLLTSTAVRLRAQEKPIIDRWRESRNLDSTKAAAPMPDASGVSAKPLSRPSSGVVGLARALTSRDTAAVILDGQGRCLADGGVLLSGELAPANPKAAHVARALSGDNEVAYIDDASGIRLLVVLIPLRGSLDEQKIIGVAQLDTPLAPVDEILLDQRLLLGGGIILALALGTLGGLWLTSSALTPLERMVVTCRQIAAGDLKQRLNLSARNDEIGQLAGAFDNMLARLEQAFTAQGRIIADSAHELRTPLTALSGVVEVLLRGAQDDPAVTNRLLRAMHGEVTRLTQLAEQLLDMTRIETPDMLRCQDLNLWLLLEEFLQQTRLLPCGQKVSLEPGESGTVSADPDALKQALFNLVTNAAQHTGASGHIRIGWRIEGNRVCVRIEDNGEGIAPEDVPHIFEPFYRGDRSRSRRRGGTGLGLALVRSIVETHGGGISVETQQGSGSMFAIWLPLIRPQTMSADG